MLDRPGRSDLSGPVLFCWLCLAGEAEPVGGICAEHFFEADPESPSDFGESDDCFDGSDQRGQGHDELDGFRDLEHV